MGYAHIQTGKTAVLILRAAIPDILSKGSLVILDSDNPEVTIRTPQVVIQERMTTTTERVMKHIL